MTITLVFRDRHTDYYSFRSLSGERAFSLTNIILCSLSKTHSIFRLHSQDIRSMNGKSLLALAHNFLRIQEVYRLVLLFFSPKLQLMWPFQPVIRGVLILVRHEETIHRLAAPCQKGFIPHNPCSIPNLDRQECNRKTANEFPTLRYEDCYCSSFKALPHMQYDYLNYSNCILSLAKMIQYPIIHKGMRQPQIWDSTKSQSAK